MEEVFIKGAMMGLAMAVIGGIFSFFAGLAGEAKERNRPKLDNEEGKTEFLADKYLEELMKTHKTDEVYLTVENGDVWTFTAFVKTGWFGGNEEMKVVKQIKDHEVVDLMK